MLDLMTLQQMREVDINTIDPASVTEASEINIDISLPVEERLASYIDQVENPYFIKVGKVIVKMNFPNTDKRANDCFERYMKIC
jgi:hypothetical protein